MKVISSEFGRYLQDFEEGTVIKHWPGKTITESDNNLFSLITMNHHPVHLDQNYAKAAQHGKVLVVGTLVFSLVVGLTVRDISGKAIANLNYSEILHHGPVHIGDTLYAETEVLSVHESKSKNDRGIVKVTTKAYNQDKDLVLSFSREVLVLKKQTNG
jgi:acyl dehydratase